MRNKDERNQQNSLDVSADQSEHHITMSNQTQYTPIVGRKADGSTVWYTGRAGEGWVSPEPRDAYLGYSLEGARRFATQQNRYTELHGIRFAAVTGDLLALFEGRTA